METEQAKKKRQYHCCKHEGCSTTASYNVPGSGTARFCAKHRIAGMQDVKRLAKRCKHEGCMKTGSFVHPGNTAKYCAEHKLPGMQYATHRCEHEGCHKAASCNVLGGRPRFCATHRLADMVNVTSKRCEHEGCTVIANFNEPGRRTGRFCASHKLPGMADVQNKRCEHDGCDVIANFNAPGCRSGRYCVRHKLEGMLCVTQQRCEHDGCNTVACFNLPGSRKGRFCVKHQLLGMEDVCNKRCKTFLCQTSANAHYQGYCMRCFIHEFPDNTVVRNHKTKERAVADFVRESFPDLSWVFDRPVHDGCSSRRPDMLLDMGEFVVIVEVDEAQHNTYDSTCENKRLMQLFLDVGSRPVVMIRFNPDAYVDGEGTKVPSCWSRTKGKNLCVVTPKQQPAWRARMLALRLAIDAALQEGTCGKTIREVKLYFDQI